MDRSDGTKWTCKIRFFLIFRWINGSRYRAPCVDVAAGVGQRHRAKRVRRWLRPSVTLLGSGRNRKSYDDGALVTGGRAEGLHREETLWDKLPLFESEDPYRAGYSLDPRGRQRRHR
jgi:hypothetical protein